LSPWDRHEKTYGDSDLYNEYFKNQLRELLTGYGDIFAVWFDGACGEGLNGRRQVYDWDGYYSVIRELQPEAVICVCGPDVRWCGNEAGHCRDSEWSVVPAALLDAEKVAEKSQKEDDGKFSKSINSIDEDLGSRKVIENVENLAFYPAEVNTSIRPGWFYHTNEDNQVKSAEQLLDIYYKSVGGNANFLLNLPPDKRGLIHENDASTLRRFGQILRETFAENLAENALIWASECMNDLHVAQNVLDDNSQSFWCPREGTERAELTIDLKSTKTFNRVVLMENIESSGQRVEKFVLCVRDEDEWKEIYWGTVIGYKRICCFETVEAQHMRLKITQSRWYPTIAHLGVFLEKI
jgi:alpha-L-fucosidase